MSVRRKEAIERVKGLVRRHEWPVYKAATKRTKTVPGISVIYGFRHPLEVSLIVHGDITVSFESILEAFKAEGYRITYENKEGLTVCVFPPKQA